MRALTEARIAAADKRNMDRLLWRLRSHIRSARLPRPNRVVITDPNPTIYLDYGVGEGKTRLRHLLAWCVSLPDMQLRCVLRANGYLAVWATGSLTTTPVLVSAGADLHDLGGRLEHTSGAIDGHVATLTFTTDEVTTLDRSSLAAALNASTDPRAVAA